MITASELAGFFAAHAVWCVSDGDTLIPMLAYTNEGNERHMDRFAHDDLGVAVECAKQKLATNEMDANDAVLIYDGRITLTDDKLDALILELRSYVSPGSAAVLAVPYTPKGSGQFRVHKPKLLAWDNCDEFDMNQAFESFFHGVSQHEKGSKIWEQCLDESR